MADLPPQARNSIARQADLFRLAERDCGLTIAALARMSGISASTLAGWRSGAAMPAWALGALGDAGVPDDLLSLVTSPWHRHVGTDPDDDGHDLDQLGEEADALASEVRRARGAKSPGGTAIIPIEAARIKERSRRVAAHAIRVGR